MTGINPQRLKKSYNYILNNLVGIEPLVSFRILFSILMLVGEITGPDMKQLEFPVPSPSPSPSRLTISPLGWVTVTPQSTRSFTVYFQENFGRHLRKLFAYNILMIYHSHNINLVYQRFLSFFT